VHEAKHGYKLYKEGPRTRANFYEHEVAAYSAQFAFDPDVVKKQVPSYWARFPLTLTLRLSGLLVFIMEVVGPLAILFMQNNYWGHCMTLDSS
jgi:hypothetical protein